MVIPFMRTRPAAQVAKAAPWDVGENAGAPSESVNHAAATTASAETAGRSDWLFAKLYCSPSHADTLLTQMVPGLLEQLNDSAAPGRWFFMRYGDPQWHLRLRFHGDPETLRARVLPLLQQRVEEEQSRGTVWRFEVDEYEPEIDRYGGPSAIHLAEELFHLDSALCLRLLQCLGGDFGTDLRWQMALGAVDRLLTALGLELEERKAVVANIARWRERDFVVDEAYKRQIAGKFRDHRKTLAAILTEVEDGTGARTAILPAEALSALAGYSAGVRQVCQKLEEVRMAGQLTRTIPELASSLVHMHLNRMFRSCHLEQEAVLCELLNRSYASRLGRGENKS